jgi:uncharacterized protein YecE (DUF72 family)
MDPGTSPPAIRTGPAGWSYPDWKGIVYPPRAGRGFEPLSFIAGLFDVVEVDSTFYRIPEPIRTGEWVRKVDGFPRFGFAVKLFQGFTHTRKASLVDERAFHRAVEPLARFRRLSAVLVQWPWSFRNTEENRRYLAELLSRFSAYPLAVEFRHASWASKDALKLLREKNTAFCNIDQPDLAHCLGPTSAVTAPLAYFRLHGRNATAWFTEGAGRDERYNYLYSAAELAPWVRSVRDAAELAEEVVVIFNNHFRGKAVANAFQLQHALSGKKQPAPAALVEAYPELEEISSTVFQRSLFAAEPAARWEDGKEGTVDSESPGAGTKTRAG